MVAPGVRETLQQRGCGEQRLFQRPSVTTGGRKTRRTAHSLTDQHLSWFVQTYRLESLHPASEAGNQASSQMAHREETIDPCNCNRAPSEDRPGGQAIDPAGPQEAARQMCIGVALRSPPKNHDIDLAAMTTITSEVWVRTLQKLRAQTNHLQSDALGRTAHNSAPRIWDGRTPTLIN